MSDGPRVSLRVLILAPHGRDAALAQTLLRDAGLEAAACADLLDLVKELSVGAGAVLAAEEAFKGPGLNALHEWIGGQPPWSDIPIVVLTHRGGGVERNPAAGRLTQTLGNVSFLERPFHPTTAISLLQVALRGRRRQYEARERLEEIRAGQKALRRANATLEERVEERSARLAETEAALRQSQKLEAIGRLTGGIAHDFNNLLMVVSGGLEVMDRQKDPEKRDRIVRSMRQATERGARLTKQLLSFSRIQTLHPQTINLVTHLQGMKTLLDHALRGDVVVEVDLPAELWPVEVDATELELAILNLCVNARDAMTTGGVIRIVASNVEENDGQYVRLIIADTGAGMSPEVQSRVFDPFFTTKDIGMGSGLGLAQVYGFAVQSGGSAHIESHVGVGTRVILLLPRSEHTPVDSPAQVHSAPRGEADRGHRILVVEDDDEVAALVGEMLTQLGHDYTRVSSPDAALGALANGRRVDLVFSDVMMPGGVSGIDLAAELRRRRPDLPILLTTGRPDAFEAPARDLSLTVLAKPYDSDALRRALTQLLDL